MNRFPFLLVILSSLISTAAFAEFENKIVRDKTIGCTTTDDRDKLVRYANQGDEQALVKFLTLKVLARDCVVFSLGETVYIADTAIFSGLVKIRRRGEVGEYWTNIEAVKLETPSVIEKPKPVEQPKAELTPQQKREIESKKCTDLTDNKEVVVCLNKLFSEK